MISTDNLPIHSENANPVLIPTKNTKIQSETFMTSPREKD
jgi:hypothetical protein